MAKKAFFFLIAIAMSFNFSCNKNISGNKSNDANTAPALKILIAGDENNGIEKISKLYEEQTGKKIDPIVIPYNDHTQKIFTMYQAGKPPGIVRTTGALELMPILLSLSGDAQLVEFSKKANAFAAGMYNDKDELAAMPVTATANGLWVNRDLFAQAKIEIPNSNDNIWSWNEFLNKVKEVKSATNVKYGLVWDVSPHRYSTLKYQYKGFTWGNNGKTVTANDKNNVLALQKFVEWHNQGFLPKSVWVGGENPSALFKAGQAVAHLSGSWQTGTYVEDFPFAEAVYMPIGVRRSSVPGGAFIAAIQKSGQEKQAREFMHYFFLNGLFDKYAEEVVTISPYGTAVKYENPKISKFMNIFADELQNTSADVSRDMGLNSSIMAAVGGNTFKDLIISAVSGVKSPQDALDEYAAIIQQELEDQKN